MSRLFATAALLLLVSTSCSRKPAAEGAGKHYTLTGKVLSLNSKDQTASIEGAAIPDYMEAMTMSYPIASKSEFESLRAGEQIQATVNVYDSGDYDLSGVKESGKK